MAVRAPLAVLVTLLCVVVAAVCASSGGSGTYERQHRPDARDTAATFATPTTYTGLAPKDDPCAAEPIPETLNSLSYLGDLTDTYYKGGFHVHGTFSVDLSVGYHDTAFTILYDTYYRVYVPPGALDVDISILDAATEAVVGESASALPLGLEESLAGVLAPGDYKLRFDFLSAASVDGGNGGVGECEFMVLELAMAQAAAYDISLGDTDNDACDVIAVFPPLNLQPLSVGQHVHYYTVDGGVTGMVPLTPAPVLSTAQNGGFEVLHEYVIDVPASSDVEHWHFEFSINYDFLSDAQIGALLQSSSDAEPADESCALGDSEEGLGGNCTVAYSTSIGSKTISHTLHGGSSYSVWLYVQTQEALGSFNQECMLFSLDVHLEPQYEVESLLTCDKPQLPASFAEPGFLNYGYMYLADTYYLNSSAPGVEVALSLQEKSYVRFTASASPNVHVEVEVWQDNTRVTTTMGASGAKSGGARAVVLELGGGEYTVKFVYAKVKANVFCDTFDVQAVVVPKRYADDFSFCYTDGGYETSTLRNEYAPDLSLLGTVNTAPTSTWGSPTTADGFDVHADVYHPFVHYYTADDWTTGGNNNSPFGQSTVQGGEILTEQDFTVTELVAFKAHVAGSHLYGDLLMRVQNVETGEKFYSKRHGDGSAMHMQLEPGEFRFTMYTGPVQATGDGVKNGYQQPPDFLCVTYTLRMLMVPLAKYDDCSHEELPTTLNAPEFLMASPRLHVERDFVIDIDSYELGSADRDMDVTVNTDSLLRVYTSENTLPTDVLLYAGSWSTETQVPVEQSAAHTDTGEVLLYVLEAGVSYSMTFRVYTTTVKDTGCYLFNLQLSVAPLDDRDLYPALPCNGATDVDALEAAVDGTVSYLDTTYVSFVQDGESYEEYVDFSLSYDVYFAAMLRYDFAWADVNFELHKGTDVVVTAESYLNRDAIPAVLLDAGDYRLHIFEPSALLDGDGTCQTYTLTMEIEDANDVHMGEDASSGEMCEAERLHPTLNDFPMLAGVDAQSFYMRGDFVVDDQLFATVPFVLTEESLLRIHLPMPAFGPERMETSALIFAGDESEITGNPKALSAESDGVLYAIANYNTETMFVTLPAATYTLILQYDFDDDDVFLYADDDAGCWTFDMSIAVAPTAEYEQYHAITNYCALASTYDESSAGGAAGTYDDPVTQSFDATYNIDLQSPRLTLYDLITLRLEETTRVTISVRFDFVTVDMDVSLTHCYQCPYATTWQWVPDFQEGMGHAYLSAELQPGDYDLSVWSTTQDPSPDALLTCGWYSLSVRLGDDGEPVCDCNGNGDCLDRYHPTVCTCDDGYVGDLCDECADDYSYSSTWDSCWPMHNPSTHTATYTHSNPHDHSTPTTTGTLTNTYETGPSTVATTPSCDAGYYYNTEYGVCMCVDSSCGGAEDGSGGPDSGAVIIVIGILGVMGLAAAGAGVFVWLKRSKRKVRSNYFTLAMDEDEAEAMLSFGNGQFADNDDLDDGGY